MKDKLNEVLQKYDPKKIRIGVLGSHSALEIAAGAKQEGFETVVVCQNGREKTYTQYYGNLFDKFIFLDKFSEITNEENVKQLTDLNTIFVPNRSFSVYAGYEAYRKQIRCAPSWVTVACSEPKNATRHEISFIFSRKRG